MSAENHGDNIASLFAHLGSAISASAILGFLAGVVPTIGILMAIIWYSVMIWETKTVREWLAHRHVRKARATLRETAALIAELKLRESEAGETLRQFAVTTAEGDKE